MLFRSKPSTSIIAEALAPKVEIPRTQKRDVLLPGCPDDCMAMIPGTLPAKALVKFDEGNCFICDTSTLVMAPVTVSFFCVPRPVTTTSSMAFVFSSDICTSITFLSPLTSTLTGL